NAKTLPAQRSTLYGDQHASREAAMKLQGAFLLALTLSAQPSLRTELRNGVVRAVVLHNSGDPVTDDAPALPGEPLIVQGSGLTEGVQILIGGTAADSVTLDDANIQIVLPRTAGGSFVEIAIANGKA